MTVRDALGIFTRTFAALALAVLVSVQGFDWASGDEIGNNAAMLGFGLLAAFLGAVAAVGWALVGTPAVTRLGKAVRAAVEKVVGGVGVIALNSVADLVQFVNLLTSLAIAAVFAFAITWLSYSAPPAGFNVKKGVRGAV